MEVKEFYEKLLRKLNQLKSGDLLLADYIKEVEVKVYFHSRDIPVLMNLSDISSMPLGRQYHGLIVYVESDKQHYKYCAAEWGITEWMPILPPIIKAN